MTLNTIRAMLRLLAAELGAEASISQEDRALIKENIGGIYTYSKYNDMAHLVGYALLKAGLISKGDEHFANFEKEQFTSIFRQENQDYELGRICDALERAGVDFIPLKGSVIRSLYPEPWMRTSCDIDILVKKEEFPIAKKSLLETLGYKQGKESQHDEGFDSVGGVHIELHFDLLEEGQTESARHIIGDVWSHTVSAEGKKHQKLMSDEMFYFYHIAHTAKHFEDSGIGMRPFLDLYLLLRDRSNEEKRQELLKLGGLDRFEGVARAIALCWFDGGELDMLAQRAEIFVLSCGTYGSESNRIILAKEKTGGKIQYVLSRVFMPYDSIKYSYPILKKHKWLLPFCQIARWLKLLSPKQAKSAAQEVKTANKLTDKELKRLKALLRDVGL